MKIFGITGHSGMGKTTLLERLVPEIAARGLTTSLIKHSHKNVDIDHPGKDSYRLREAGCKEVLLVGNNRWALMHELRGDVEPSLDSLLDRMQECDIVLVEGFKSGKFPKLEVWRSSLGKNFLWPHSADILAIASDINDIPPGIVCLPLEDICAIASFVVTNAVIRITSDYG
ncbi:MAG: molybdopterin-guanine dinucleotide biosynthesis protein B [Burkholderiales bacterium]